MGLKTVNSLKAADTVIFTVLSEYNALDALGKL